MGYREQDWGIALDHFMGDVLAEIWVIARSNVYYEALWIFVLEHRGF